MKVALTGTPQSGKTQLQNGIQRAGWLFRNLNDTGDALRTAGGPLRSQFDALLPGTRILDENGKRQAAYYIAVQRDPSLLERFTALELPHIIEAAHHHCAETGNTLVSWEQWDLIVDLVPLDHILFLQCRRDVWIERLHARSYKRGYTGQRLPDEVLLNLMYASGFHPDRMLEKIRAQVGDRTPITIVDTSGDDWGEANIVAALTSIAR